MAHRATVSFAELHVLTTVKEFVEDIKNTKVTRVSLGFPLPQYTAPWPFESVTPFFLLSLTLYKKTR